MCVTEKERQQFHSPHSLPVLFFCTLQASQAAQEAEDNARKAKNSVNNLLAVINDLLDQLGKTVLGVPYAVECLPDVAVPAAGVMCWLPCHCCARTPVALLASRNRLCVFSVRTLGFFLAWGTLKARGVVQYLFSAN